MKRRIIKKHNNTESGKRAPEYAKGIKVYELGLFSKNPDKTELSEWFMCYSCRPITSHDSAYYNLVKKRRTGHSYTEMVRGEIERYYTHLR